MQHLKLTFLFLTTLFPAAYAATFNSAGGGGQAMLTISGTYEATIPNADWFVLTNTATNGNTYTISYTILANTGSFQRTTNITVTNPGEGAQTHSITQYGSGTAVSAASYNPGKLAPNGMASFFGEALATITATSQSYAMDLGGTTVTLFSKINQQTYPAQLLFVSPVQVNFIIPPDIPVGGATVIVTGPSNAACYNTIIRPVAPDLFSVNQQGTGVAVSTMQYNQGETVTYQDGTNIDISTDPNTNFLVALWFGAAFQ